MSYTKFFNISERKDGNGVVARLTADLADLTNNGSEARIEKGAYLTVRTKDEQLEELTRRLKEGTIDEAKYESRVERVSRIPDFVFAHVHTIVDKKYYPIADILINKKGGKYIKIKCDQIVIADNGKKTKLVKEGFGNLNTRAQELERIQWLLDNGKMKEDTFLKVKGDIDQVPDFVLFRCDAKGEEA